MTRIRVERLRWWVADALNRLPSQSRAGQCWARLVTWALGYTHAPNTNPLPWRPIDEYCRLDAARTGECGCGKLRRPACSDSTEDGVW